MLANIALDVEWTNSTIVIGISQYSINRDKALLAWIIKMRQLLEKKKENKLTWTILQLIDFKVTIYSPKVILVWLLRVI